MTVSVADSFIIAIVCVACVAAFIGITLFASRRPYFKHPKPDSGPTGVSGGRHVGDPRSVSPHGPVPVPDDEPADREQADREQASPGRVRPE
ncbi:MAG TPA: hypothetical protein VGM53_17740 [Streptosporangiaceae bacterium]|jgi:hypothetical protein